MDILVVNDCSTDDTANVVKSLNIPCLDLPINLGIGGAMQTGYIFARDNNYDFAVQVDGDGQHDPREIEKLRSAHKKTGASLVIGSRFSKQTDYQSAFSRRLGIYIFSVITKILTGQSIKDATSGFRLANREVIQLFADYYPSDYPEPEVIVYLKNKGLDIYETPVKMSNRSYGKSSITPIKSVYYMIKVISAMFMQKLRG